MTELSSIDFAEYRSAVENLAEHDAKNAILCTRPRNGSTLYEILFDRARESIRIFDPSFSPDLFNNGEVLSSLERAAARHVGIHIIAGGRNKVNETDEYLRRFSYSTPFVTYTQIPRMSKAASQKERFVVIDSKALRFVNSDGKGIAYMNNPEIAKRLVETFNLIRESFK